LDVSHHTNDGALLTASLGEIKLSHTTGFDGTIGLKWLAVTDAKSSQAVLTTCGTMGIRFEEENKLFVDFKAVEPILFTHLPKLTEKVDICFPLRVRIRVRSTHASL